MNKHTAQVAEKKDRGFTLVELLIVIVILGILATVTVFAVRGITDQGKTSACAADLKTNEVAIETYYAKFGTLNAPSTS
ncbi:MAG: type II secretion system protein, partial [Actinomycetota bacterium]